MKSIKQYTLLLILSCSSIIASMATNSSAKSLYAIINHQFDIIGAYSIDGSQITYQTDIQAPQHSVRIIDLCIDSDSSCLFVTYEGSDTVEIMNAKTLENEGSTTAVGASNLAGIVFHEGRQHLYTVDRATRNLFVYSWNPETKSLTPYGSNPKTLNDLSGEGAYGIALDTVNGNLYVTNFTNTVHYYDIDNWSHLGSIDIGQIAVDIDVDTSGRYLYAGGYYSHHYLTKVNLTGGTPQHLDIGAGVIGLAVDQDSGLVYTTTYHNQLRVYDTSSYPFTLTDFENISAGAGVCVPLGDVVYKPNVFYLAKDDGVSCVSPEDQFTYTISYGANGYADTSVYIIDYLPNEVDYVSCSGGGTYDPVEHTVTWNLGSLSSGSSGTLNVTVQVNYYAKPATSIVNTVEMEGDNYRGQATEETDICCYGGPIIYVDKDATSGYDNGTSWDNAYLDLQDALNQAQNCSGITDIWVAAGTYKPTDDPSESTASFVLVDGVDTYGHFAGVGTYETSIGQRNFYSSAYETVLDGRIGSQTEGVEYVVTAESITDLTFDGFTVTGSYSGAGILIEDCPNANLRIVNCSIEGNHEYGIHSKAQAGSVSHFDLQDCTISGNSKYGLYCERSWPLIVETVFDGQNQTQCAIGATQSTIDIYDSQIMNHTGSGVYLISSTDMAMNDCSVSSNSGFGVECHSSNEVILNRCTLENNDSSGIASEYSGVEIADSTIRGNGGAGIGSRQHSDLALTRSRIYSNTYDGIYLEDSLWTSITDNYIYDNLGNGPYTYAGIYLQGAIGQAEIRNNTICDNHTYGIYHESGTEPEVVSCTVYDNSTQIGTGSGQPLSNVTYSCVESGYAGTGNISSDPLFVDASNGDYRVTWDSECVDAGKLNSTEEDETDIDGNPRVLGGRVDIGADEDYPHCRPEYDDWVFLGRPDCWMTPYQCDGDADGAVQGFQKYRVMSNDLDVVSVNWKKTAGDPTLNPCADLDHREQGFQKYRVMTNDLSILIENWKKTDADLPGDCADCSRSMAMRNVAEPTMSIEKMINWLAEIWLDPEVQETIDEKAWKTLLKALSKEAKHQ